MEAKSSNNGEAALLDRVRKGEVIMVGEWRQCNVEAVKMRDPKTGTIRQAVVLRHGLETVKEQFSLSEWMPDGTDPKSVVVPYVKGQRVLVLLTSLARERGLLTVGGKLEAL